MWIMTFALAAQALDLEPEAWEPAGLQGLDIWALEISPSGVILAGTGGGVENNVFRRFLVGPGYRPAGE